VKLKRDFYEQPTPEAARRLLGKFLVRHHPDGTTVGRIVETEAYVGPQDKASHASRGLTARNAVMFGPAGYAYVYLVYGFHYCLNIVTEKRGYPAAVLIRALEPMEGIEIMERRRRTTDYRKLASGPGRLCQAFAIDLALNGIDLCGDVLYVEDSGERAWPVVAATRIGVDYAGAWRNKPFRFYIRGHACVSRARS